MMKAMLHSGGKVKAEVRTHGGRTWVSFVENDESVLDIFLPEHSDVAEAAKVIATTYNNVQPNAAAKEGE